MDVSSPWGQGAVIFPPSRIGFPSLPTASLSIVANISSVLLISMKRRCDFCWRKPFLFRHRPSGRTLARVDTIQRQSFTAFLQFGFAHCLKAFSKQWQHYLQDSYKTGFVRIKNNKACSLPLFFLFFFFPSPLLPHQSPKPSLCQSKIQPHFLRGTCTCLFQGSQQLTAAQTPGRLSGGTQNSKVASQHL